MLHLSGINELRANIKAVSSKNVKIGLVPTMGFLHEGHLSLIKHIKRDCDFCVVSIYINPLQFNNPEDLQKYPRDIDRDLAMLRKENVDLVFTPLAFEMQTQNQQTTVRVSKLTTDFEGKFRPGHFDGVATIVTSLFNLVTPDCAIFGEKDFQQLRVVEQLVSDLKYNIKILRAPIIRESDGLALSSRNVRLSEQGRFSATAISRGLKNSQALFLNGETDAQILKACVASEIKKEVLLKFEYVALIDENTFTETPKATSNSRLLISTWCEDVRLIDNLSFNP